MTIDPLGIHSDEATRAAMPRPDRCETCRFWERDEPIGCANGDRIESQIGECRKNPPVAMPGDEEEVRDCCVWPTPGPFDWCGEWQEKPEPFTRSIL